MIMHTFYSYHSFVLAIENDFAFNGDEKEQEQEEVDEGWEQEKQ